MDKPATAPSRPVAIVTGASAGIGLAIAHALAGAGYRLAITGRSEDRLDEAARSIHEESGVDVLPITADASSPADMEQLVVAVAEESGGLGRLDVLVNNAGVAPLIPVEESDSMSFLETFLPNVFGPAAAIRAAWPIFKSQQAGCVVNISSWAARDPFPGFFIYAASKAALNSLTRSCVNDAAQEGFPLRAFSIGPGAVETDLLRASFDEQTLPAEACLAPADVAELVLACVNGDHDASNGRAIYVRRGGEGSVETEVL